MFMHGGLLHIGGNMLFLWIFGNNVEDAMGPLRFLAFYLLGGLAARRGADRSSTRRRRCRRSAPRARSPPCSAATWCCIPRARVLTFVFIVFFFTIIELPAILFLGIWILQQILFGYFDLVQPTGGGGGVAYFAHIGGFVLGLLTVRLIAKEDRTRRQVDARGEGRDHPRRAGLLLCARLPDRLRDAQERSRRADSACRS